MMNATAYATAYAAAAQREQSRENQDQVRTDSRPLMCSRSRFRLAMGWGGMLALVIASLLPGALARDKRVTNAAYTAALLEAVDYAVIVVDKEGTIRHFTGGAERLLGVQANQVIGQPMLWMVPREMVAAHEAGFKQFWESDQTQPWVIACTAQTYDGTKFPCRMRLNPVKTDVHGWLIVVQMEPTNGVPVLHLP